METAMLGIKYVLFLALELFVIAAMGAALIAGLYQVVRDKIRESRRLDEVATEAPPAASTANVVTRYS